jgi:glycine/D-amino acid oxidase-like deaminating enzyme
MPVLDWERPLPAQCHVAIIGAGLTGLAAARALARRGADVVVLEAETVGWGASARNGGMVLTGLKVGAAELVQRYGRDLARRLFAASLAAIDCVEALVAEEQIACNFARSGHLEVASKPAHFVGFQRSAEAIEREFGHQARLIAMADLGAEIGSNIYHGGLVDEISAGVNPARLVAGLARAAERAGAKLYEGARVGGLERAARGFRLTTTRGTLQAEHVVIATSGYTGRAMQPAARPLTRRIVPIGSYIIATEPLPEALAQTLIPRGRMAFDSRNFLAYYRLTPDRRMLFGGRARFLPESPATVLQSASILRRALVKVYPPLAEAEIDYAWGGTLDFAFDLMPHAGQQDGVHYSLGYAGHGVALATYLGTLLGETLAGTPRDNPFADVPFPDAPLGLYDGRPWFLPFAGAWYRLLDLVS